MNRTSCLATSRAQTRQTDEYKSIPCGYNKSRVNKLELCQILVDWSNGQAPPAKKTHNASVKSRKTFSKNSKTSNKSRKASSKDSKTSNKSVKAFSKKISKNLKTTRTNVKTSVRPINISKKNSKITNKSPQTIIRTASNRKSHKKLIHTPKTPSNSRKGKKGASRSAQNVHDLTRCFNDESIFTHEAFEQDDDIVTIIRPDGTRGDCYTRKSVFNFFKLNTCAVEPTHQYYKLPLHYMVDQRAYDKLRNKVHKVYTLIATLQTCGEHLVYTLTTDADRTTRARRRAT